MADEPLTDGPDASVAAPESSELADLQRERDDYKDRWLRKTAEFDNYRKRVERERREQADQAVVDILQELLLVVDDFDRALTVGCRRGRRRVPQGRRADSRQAARPAAQAGRDARWTCSAPTSIRTSTRP